MSIAEYYSVKQVAEHFSVTVQCVYKWIKAGDLPGLKIGGKVMIPKQELDKTVAKAIKRF